MCADICAHFLLIAISAEAIKIGRKIAILIVPCASVIVLQSRAPTVPSRMKNANTAVIPIATFISSPFSCFLGFPCR